MEYIVKIRLKDSKGVVKLEWPEEVVDKPEKWEALVAVAERLGLAERVTMSDLWKWSKIRKKERKDMALRRKKDE